MKRNGWRYTPFSLAGWVLMAGGLTLIYVGAFGDSTLLLVGAFVCAVGQGAFVSRWPRLWLKERVYASGVD